MDRHDAALLRRFGSGDGCARRCEVLEDGTFPVGLAVTRAGTREERERHHTEEQMLRSILSPIQRAHAHAHADQTTIL